MLGIISNLKKAQVYRRMCLGRQQMPCHHTDRIGTSTHLVSTGGCRPRGVAALLYKDYSSTTGCAGVHTQPQYSEGIVSLRLGIQSETLSPKAKTPHQNYKCEHFSRLLNNDEAQKHFLEFLRCMLS